MYIVIVGCGSLGSRLATVFSTVEHDVVVVDEDPEAFENLGPGFNGLTVRGTGIDVDVLKKAGADHADALAAVTSNDNTNIMIAQIAKTVFGIPKVVARVFDPDRESVYSELGLETVSPTAEGVREISNWLAAGDAHRILSVGAGEVAIVQIRVKNGEGKTVSSVEIPTKLKVISVTRDTTTSIPSADFVLAAGDLVTLAVRPNAVPTAVSILGS
ncbi:MAG TPA: TrkA family potassium uptake protein [Firmicutes bacterium]|nr:TrkA family potassium uptake protein [Bacillota bacterium]